MSDQREGHEPGRAGSALKEDKSPKANVRSLAVLLLQLLEFMLDANGDSRERELLASGKELVRRTQ